MRVGGWGWVGIGVRGSGLEVRGSGLGVVAPLVEQQGDPQEDIPVEELDLVGSR